MSLTPYQFRFTGTAAGFFPIWLVNTLLIAVTGGAYYAWAKVKTKRYFYRNTTFAKGALEYHGSALDIFKGWLLATVFSVAAYLAAIFAPQNALPFAAAAIFLVPWVVVSTLSYRARHTSFRDVRFDFSGSFDEALTIYVMLPVLTVLSAGLTFPYLCYRHRRYVVENHWFGGWQFSFRGKPGDYYFFAILALILIGIGLGGGWGIYTYGQLSPQFANLVPIAAPLVAVVFCLAGISYFMAAVENFGYNATTLGNSNFKSRIGTGRLFILYLTNIFAIGLSGGLLMPWVKIRMARYRGQTLQFIAVRDMEKLLRDIPKREISDAHALGEGFALEFGL